MTGYSFLTPYLLILLTILGAESQEWKDRYGYPEPPVENSIDYPPKSDAYYQDRGEITPFEAKDPAGKFSNMMRNAAYKRSSRDLGYGYRDDSWDDRSRSRSPNRLSPYPERRKYDYKNPQAYKSPTFGGPFGSSRRGPMADKSHLAYKSRYSPARSKMGYKPWLRAHNSGRGLNRNKTPFPSPSSPHRFARYSDPFQSQNHDIVAAIDRIAAKLG